MTESPPQFGLVDLVDAFTAMRHEYRTQVKETRQLTDRFDETTERLIEAVRNLELISCQPAAGHAASVDADEATDRFAMTLIELDIQLDRAVAVAMAQHIGEQQTRSAAWQSVRNVVDELSPMGRWFARPLIRTLEALSPIESKPSTVVIDGLSILLGKLRETMQRYEIRRTDVLGRPFDGETMRALGILTVDGIASGNVSEQLTATYRRQGRVIQFANVRVAP
ncbi:nucleotide exchange factor GrpE [Neorhodopirellula pilleata]|uniref:Protein GrpE n=1 Tax=Neorhodopirellula pilleata TaxID=2714738 RepID=A0A5C5ZFZ8_9BACT|nr:nucleotide exchange factor GrpE [Neorhodopirellula pilleata]TWT86040.1 Protein GrpE [Neorhodopirellula pilleata]